MPEKRVAGAADAGKNAELEVCEECGRVITWAKFCTYSLRRDEEEG